MKSHAESLDHKTLLALVDASRAIISETSLEEVFQRIAEQAAAVLNAEGGSVLIYDAERKELRFEAASGPGSEQIMGMRFDSELGIAGQVVKTGRGMRVDDAQTNKHFFGGVDVKTKSRTRSLLAAPLIHGDRVLGVVEVINPVEGERFTNRDLELLQIFANLAAAGASTAQAFDRVTKENRALIASTRHAPKVVGQSRAIRQAVEMCQRVAKTNSTVLLLGETGTGKELAARAIHEFSPRCEKPMIAINCAALPESLLESELFGHEKGAFTGATGVRPGRFELADGGTLFLDEIGEISPAIQAKLLRALAEREFVRVGGVKTMTCDVRVVAATNRDLRRECEAGRFREDLYYRLNVFPVKLPPLRERLEDLPLLIEHFSRDLAPNIGIDPPRVSDEALACMMSYGWPGNIRELKNVVERCMLLCSDGVIDVDILPAEFDRGGRATGEKASDFAGSKLAGHERAMIIKALNETNWNQSKAARQLGISRDHLRYRIKKYDLRAPEGME